jgi:hypothetical protein
VCLPISIQVPEETVDNSFSSVLKVIKTPSGTAGTGAVKKTLKS